MSTNITLRRRVGSAVLAGAAALLIGAGAATYSAPASQELRVQADGNISYDALRRDHGTEQYRNQPPQQANDYSRGCAASQGCRG